MKSYTFNAPETIFIEIKEQPKHLFLFFHYETPYGVQWRLTSNITAIRQLSDSLLITTQNSTYELKTPNYEYESVSKLEFIYCRLGLTPQDAKELTSCIDQSEDNANKTLH